MATRLGKRPHPKNYATYDPKGKAQYRKDLAEYLKKKAAIEKEKNKLSTKKNIEKQKTSNKKASTAKPKTTAKPKVTPKATATKGKSLATGKTTRKPKAVETVKTPKVTTTKRRAATSTKKKVTPKAKATVKKPAVKPAGKVPARKPIISNKQKLQIKKAGKKVVSTGKKVVASTKKNVSKLKTEGKKLLNKPSPTKRPVTKGQKLASKGNQILKKTGKYIRKQVLPKAKKDAVKLGKGILKDPKSLVKGVKGAGIAYVAEQGLNQLTDRAIKQLSPKTRGKNMTLKEYRAMIEKNKKAARKKYGPLPGYGMIYQGIKKRITGEKKTNNNQSSTTKNIKKQKTSNNTGLKIKKTERSSKVNRNKDYNAKTATKKRNTALSEFRVDPKENRKLQLEAQNKKPITYSRQLSTKAKNQISDTKKNKDKKTTRSSFNEKYIRGKGGRLLRRGSVTARRAENKERARKRAQELARQRRLRK